MEDIEAVARQQAVMKNPLLKENCCAPTPLKLGALGRCLHSKRCQDTLPDWS